MEEFCFTKSRRRMHDNGRPFAQINPVAQSLLRTVAKSRTSMQTVSHRQPADHQATWVPPHARKNKRFVTCDNPKVEAIKLLRGLFATCENAKAIVILNDVKLVRELAREWGPLFNLVWVHGQLSSEQKAARARSFMNDGSKKLLIGTKLVTEGISISSLKMVIIINFWPNILEFIQMNGRLRESGLCYMLRGRSRYPSFHDQLLPAVNETCLAAQIREFYNISVSGGNPHSGCCGALPTLPSATRDLLEDVNTAVRELGTDSYVNPTSDGLTQADNDLPFRTADAKRFKSNFHAWQGFKDVFSFLSFTGSAGSNLYLYGIGIHFCPWGVFTDHGKCKDCLKDRDLCLCPRPDGTPETEGKSYRRIAIGVLAVHRMLLDDVGYKEYLEIIEPYYEDFFPYLNEFHQKRKDIYMKILETYSWYLDLVVSTKPIRALDSVRGVRLSGVFSKASKEIYETYSCLWHKLKDQKTNVPLLFFNFEWDALETIWELDEDRSEALVKCPVIKSLFDRIRSLSSCTFQGPGYLKEQFFDQHITRKQEYRQSKLELDYRMDMTSFPHWNLYLLMQIGMFYNAALMRRVTVLLDHVEEVRLFPHWLALQSVRIEMHDGQDVPLYMLVVAIFLEMLNTSST